MQLIEDGNYYIQLEITSTKVRFWEIAGIRAGHIRWMQQYPSVPRLTIQELIDTKTPMIKIPAPEKLQVLRCRPLRGRL